MAGISWIWLADRVADWVADEAAELVEALLGGAVGAFAAAFTDPAAGVFCGCSGGAGAGLPRLSTGRSLSSGGVVSCVGSCADGIDGEEDAGAAGDGAAGGTPDEPDGVDGVAGDSGGLGFSLPARRRTGGPSSSFMPRGVDGGGFFTAFLALIEAAVCQVPSAIHSVGSFASFFCRAPVTVNSPWETPVRMPS